MILISEEYESLDLAKSTQLISCICDYCNNNFVRRKAEIIRGYKIIQKDCCINKECKSKKQKEVCLIKYGTSCSLHNSAVKQKTIKTNLEKFGCENPFANKEIKEKIIKTNLEKFGETSFTKTPEYVDKSNKTHIEKYGKHSSKTKETQEKRKKTNIAKYGFPYASQNNNIKIKIFKDGNQKLNYGKTQKELEEFLSSYGDFKPNRTILKGKEIDLYSEKLNFGIEYCGLYWHCENSPEPRLKNYHWLKYEMCRKNNIRLITIFSDEWNNRKTQCKNFLKSALKQHDCKIYARKCEIKELNFEIIKDFCNKYHIQGKPSNAKIGYGIYYSNQLIGMISLGVHHRNSNLTVLNRMCFKDNIQVTGGTQRLWSKCINWCNANNTESVITWSDNRWSNGNIYKKLGFELEKELPPDYSYVNLNRPEKRISKQSQKKNNECPKDMTEKNWTLSKGLSRIWDCGKIRWIFKMKK